MSAINQAQAGGARLAQACQMVGISARTIERWRDHPEGEDARQGPHHRPNNALSPAEESQVLSVLTSSRYAELSPKQLVPQLADEGVYLASESTFYRLQRRHGLRKTRRPMSRTHVTRSSTVHRASAPDKVWSWDITWLPTNVRGIYLYLYLVMDVWSRRIVGWKIADRESAELAAEFITEVCRDARSIRGAWCCTPTMANLCAAALWSRRCSGWVWCRRSAVLTSLNNPYSESLFRTLKHTPAYPRLPFADGQAARRWVERFVSRYNRVHRHSALRFVTPDERHCGREHDILARRHQLYQRARNENPERWSRATRNWTPIGLVVLNPPRADLQAAA